MTTLAIVDGDRFKDMESVADLTMKGYTATEIAKQLDIKRKDVLTLQADYREVLSKDTEARDMARDHLNQMVKHYDRLIKKFYDLIDDIDGLSFSHQVAAQKNAAIKAIAELEAKRLDALQKAGLLESSELGDELADMEEKQELLINILRNDLCPECKAKVAYELSHISGRAEIIDQEIIN